MTIIAIGLLAAAMFGSMAGLVACILTDDDFKNNNR